MKINSSACLVAVCIGVFYLISTIWAGKWQTSMEHGDSSGYYIHVVSFFIHQDAGDYTKTLDDFLKEFPSSSYLLDDPFWMKETLIGKKVIKYPIGIAMMEMPAFLLAHVYTFLVPNFERNGWTKPYLFSVHLIQIIYVAWAFYLLFLVLEQYFNRKIVVVTLFSIAFGTNLFIQSTFLAMAHTFQFFNISLLIYLTHRFYKAPRL